jgi:hypothetical protein
MPDQFTRARLKIQRIGEEPDDHEVIIRNEKEYPRLSDRNGVRFGRDTMWLSPVLSKQLIVKVEIS